MTENSPPPISSGNYPSLRSLNVSCLNFQGSLSPNRVIWSFITISSRPDCEKGFWIALIDKRIAHDGGRLTFVQPPYNFVCKLELPSVTPRLLSQFPGVLTPASLPPNCEIKNRNGSRVSLYRGSEEQKVLWVLNPQQFLLWESTAISALRIHSNFCCRTVSVLGEHLGLPRLMGSSLKSRDR